MATVIVADCESHKSFGMDTGNVGTPLLFYDIMWQVIFYYFSHVMELQPCFDDLIYNVVREERS